ncbi:hypothetical protein AWV80_17430 [Cupriavidus sp. UYMU48A]|nr:hypothetical protein AWV80_17430 [Cupriavidus sp. UYMU48A]
MEDVVDAWYLSEGVRLNEELIQPLSEAFLRSSGVLRASGLVDRGTRRGDGSMLTSWKMGYGAANQAIAQQVDAAWLPVWISPKLPARYSQTHLSSEARYE